MYLSYIYKKKTRVIQRWNTNQKPGTSYIVLARNVMLYYHISNIICTSYRPKTIIIYIILYYIAITVHGLIITRRKIYIT